MRDADEENAFVEAFIAQNRRERYKTLLANAKKRAKILDRLNHNVWDFDSMRAHPITSQLLGDKTLEEFLIAQGAKRGQNVYIISDSRKLDGLHLPLSQAIAEIYQKDFTAVACCVRGKLAFYKPEAPDYGYVLVNPPLAQTHTTK